MTVTQERLMELLSYDPESGKFSWRNDRRNGNVTTVMAGQEAGTAQGNGYRVISVDGKNYPAHRLAWLYMTGSLPPNDIDHVNCVRDDNRFCNLRSATRQQNASNRKINRNSSSGFKGVRLQKRTGRWEARIRVGYRYEHLGTFETPEDAHAAYCVGAERYHGEFARFE